MVLASKARSHQHNQMNVAVLNFKMKILVLNFKGLQPTTNSWTQNFSLVTKFAKFDRSIERAVKASKGYPNYPTVIYARKFVPISESFVTNAFSAPVQIRFLRNRIQIHGTAISTRESIKILMIEDKIPTLQLL